jgi:hypothetical protein
MDGASAPLTYRLVVKGRLSDRLASAFEGLRVEPRPGETELTGDFVDLAQLYALIDRLRDLGIELVSVNAAR